jgi:hypothetical protein
MTGPVSTRWYLIGAAVGALGRLVGFLVDLIALAVTAVCDVLGWLWRRPLLTGALVLSLAALIVAGPVGLLGLGAVAVLMPLVWARLGPSSYQRWMGLRLLGRWQRLLSRAGAWRLGTRPVADDATAGDTSGRVGPPSRPGCGQGRHGIPRDAAGLCPFCDEVLAGVGDPTDPDRMLWFDPLGVDWSGETDGRSLR